MVRKEKLKLERVKIPNLSFRCWCLAENDKQWKELEAEPHLKVRGRPRWLPRKLWFYLINKLFFYEAVLEATDGYSDMETATVRGSRDGANLK